MELEECNKKIEEVKQWLSEAKMAVVVATENLAAKQQTKSAMEFRLKKLKLERASLQFSEQYKTRPMDAEIINSFTEAELNVIYSTIVSASEVGHVMYKIREIKQLYPTWELASINTIPSSPENHFLMSYSFTFTCAKQKVFFTCKFYTHFKIVNVSSENDHHKNLNENKK